MLIRSCLALGLRPNPPWQNCSEAVWSLYDRYLQKKTRYRPRATIEDCFTIAGFQGRWLDNPPGGWRTLLPASLRDNGFPNGSLLLCLAKPA